MLIERYLKNNPAVRWSLILFFVLALLLEGLLIADKTVEDFALIRRNDINPIIVESTSSAESQALNCVVINPAGLRVREKPANGENIIKIWTVNTSFLAFGRSGDIPWLLVQVGEHLGWVLSEGDDRQRNIECEGELLALPSGSLELAAIQSQPIVEVESEPSPTSTARPRQDRLPTATLIPTMTPTQTTTPTEIPTTIPTEIPTTTSIPIPISTSTSTSTLTQTSFKPQRLGNGPNFYAVRRTFDINMDGQLDEWGNVGVLPVNNHLFQPENYLGPQDLSGVVRAVWDEQHLYLSAQVTDDVVVQESEGDQLRNGDAIELFWDSNLEEDFGINQYNGDDTQIAFTPGGIVDNLDNLYYVYQSGGGNNGDGIEVWSWKTTVGYNLEIRIPWTVLGTNPQSGATFGYAITFSDDDTPGSAEQETQLATTINNPQLQPTGWGNFILEP